MSSGRLLGELPGIPVCERVASLLCKWAEMALLLKQEGCDFIAEKTRGESFAPAAFPWD